MAQAGHQPAEVAARAAGKLTGEIPGRQWVAAVKRRQNPV